MESMENPSLDLDWEELAAELATAAACAAAIAATAEAALCGNVTLIMGSSAAKVIISCVSQIISTMFEDF